MPVARSTRRLGKVLRDPSISIFGSGARSVIRRQRSAVTFGRRLDRMGESADCITLQSRSSPTTGSISKTSSAPRVCPTST
jgi:hypothetical protein